MKKVIPDGTIVKHLRINSERTSTQKELAHEMRISERMLRSIENENAQIGVDLLDRLAKWFGVHRDQILKSVEAQTQSQRHADKPLNEIFPELFKDRIVPRHDYDLAYATTDEGKLFKEASVSNDVVCSIDVSLSDEVAGYAQELFEILAALTWESRDIRSDIAAKDEIAIRRRIKMLLVLLKGNDVWVYQTSFYRRLPERYEPLPEGECAEMKNRLVVALGSPCDYGEESIKVSIDHGQPFFLPGWKFDRTGVDGDA